MLLRARTLSLGTLSRKNLAQEEESASLRALLAQGGDSGHQVQPAGEGLQAVNNQPPRHRGRMEEIRHSGEHSKADALLLCSGTGAKC